jgi:hypothetical protein
VERAVRLLIGLIVICVLGFGFNKFRSNQTASNFQQVHDNINDCRRSRDTPFEICIYPEWKQLDREIRVEYANAEHLFDGNPGALNALKAQHAEVRSVLMYRAILDAPAGASPRADEMRAQTNGPSNFAMLPAMQAAAEEPGIRLKRYLKFLKSLTGPREGLAGRWVNAKGEAVIANDLFGRPQMRVRTRELKILSEGCDAHGPASIGGDAATVIAAKASKGLLDFGARDDARAASTITAQRRGALLEVSDSRRGGSNPRPYCDGKADLSGLYFPAK